jgi:hypothetical protein
LYYEAAVKYLLSVLMFHLHHFCEPTLVYNEGLDLKSTLVTTILLKKSFWFSTVSDAAFAHIEVSGCAKSPFFSLDQ